MNSSLQLNDSANVHGQVHQNCIVNDKTNGIDSNSNHSIAVKQEPNPSLSTTNTSVSSSTPVHSVKTESHSKPSQPVTIVKPDTSMLCILTCPRCPNSTPDTIEEDFHEGHFVCTQCGTIIGSQVISTQSEWRNFNDDDGLGGDDPNRVGGPEGGLLDIGLGTTIGLNADGSVSSLSRYQTAVHLMQRSGENNTLTSTTKLLEAFKVVDKLAAKLQLPATIVNRAKELYAKIESTKAILRRKEVVVCACLFIACKVEGHSRTMKEIEEVSDCRLKSISHCYSAIKKLTIYRDIKQAIRQHQLRLTQQTLGSQANEACNLLERYCSALNLPYPVVRAASIVIERADELNISAGRQVATLAGAAMYFVCQSAQDERLRRNFIQIGLQTKQAKSTMQNLYVEFWKRRHELAPQGWATTQQIEQMPPQ